MPLNAIILAAGKGTRMKSEVLKVAHKVAGQPIVNYVLDTVNRLKPDNVYMVIGHQKDLIQKLTAQPKMKYVIQEEQLGTGHATVQVEPFMDLTSESDILILAGDCPLLTLDTLSKLTATHNETNASATILTTKMEDPASYGRIIRGEMGSILGIREAKDCTEEELKVNEINTGVYCFNSKKLFEALKNTNTNNKQKEYYLTDVIEILKDLGETVSSYCTPNSDEAIGINTRIDLAKSNKVIYQRNNHHFMEEGVTIIDPDTTFIDSTVKIGRDSIIYPFTMIQGTTNIGKNCFIGPNSFIQNGNIADNTTLPPYSQIGTFTEDTAPANLG